MKMKCADVIPLKSIGSSAAPVPTRRPTSASRARRAASRAADRPEIAEQHQPDRTVGDADQRGAGIVSWRDRRSTGTKPSCAARTGAVRRANAGPQTRTMKHDVQSNLIGPSPPPPDTVRRAPARRFSSSARTHEQQHDEQHERDKAEPERPAHARLQRRDDDGLRVQRPPDVDRPVDERHVRHAEERDRGRSFSDPGPP